MENENKNITIADGERMKTIFRHNSKIKSGRKKFSAFSSSFLFISFSLCLFAVWHDDDDDYIAVIINDIH